VNARVCDDAHASSSSFLFLVSVEMLFIIFPMQEFRCMYLLGYHRVYNNLLPREMQIIDFFLGLMLLGLFHVPRMIRIKK
jgi:hypothetical protein